MSSFLQKLLKSAAFAKIKKIFFVILVVAIISLISGLAYKVHAYKSESLSSQAELARKDEEITDLNNRLEAAKMHSQTITAMYNVQTAINVDLQTKLTELETDSEAKEKDWQDLAQDQDQDSHVWAKQGLPLSTKDYLRKLGVLI